MAPRVRACRDRQQRRGSVNAGRERHSEADVADMPVGCDQCGGGGEAGLPGSPKAQVDQAALQSEALIPRTTLFNFLG
jgi:hypothetical protein